MDNVGGQLSSFRFAEEISLLGWPPVERIHSYKIAIVGENPLSFEIWNNLHSCGCVDVAFFCSEFEGQNYWPHDLRIKYESLRKSAGSLEFEPSYFGVERIESGTWDILVSTSVNLEENLRLNQISRSKNRKFILANVFGLTGRIFTDFGTNFTYSEFPEETRPKLMVSSITQDFPCTVSLPDNQRLGLETGDVVAFEGVQGMDELNAGGPFTVTVTSSHTFSVQKDTRSLGPYISGGYVRKIPKKTGLRFECLQEASQKPSLEDDESLQLHSIYSAASSLVPHPNNVSNAAECFRILEPAAGTALRGLMEAEGPCSHGKRSTAVDEELIQSALSGTHLAVAPVVSVISGMAVQEVIKACTAVHKPIHQWFYFCAHHCLPSPPHEQQAGIHQRMEEQLQSQKWMIAGMGPIGCQLLKLLTLMGAATGPSGALLLADAVPGGGLLQPADLGCALLSAARPGQSKAGALAEQVKALSPATNLLLLNSAVSQPGFAREANFQDLSGVLCSLEGSSARVLLDSLCVSHGKPMIDGGRHREMGSVQVCLPAQSESYSCSLGCDPPADPSDAPPLPPLCTLHNFPFLPDHTVLWALATFHSLFRERPRQANAYLEVRKSSRLQQTELRQVQDALQERPLSFEDCIVWARSKFEQLFRNAVLQLLHNFPANAEVAGGAPFWSGSKRSPPSPLFFSGDVPGDPWQMAFVQSAANLQAQMYGLTGLSLGTEQGSRTFHKVLSEYKSKEFTPKEGVRIAVSEADGAPVEEGDGEGAGEGLPSKEDLVGYCLHDMEFDPRQPGSHAADFITSAAILRARNYGIPELDPVQVRLLAGNVRPGLPSTAAVTAGLMCLELCKWVQGKAVQEHRQWYFNLASGLLLQAAPRPPASRKVSGSGGKEFEWTVWDRLRMDAVGLSLRQFLAKFQEEHGLEASMVSCGSSLLYTDFLKKKTIEERLRWTLPELVENVARVKLVPEDCFLTLSVSCLDVHGEDVEVPDVIVRVKK